MPRVRPVVGDDITNFRDHEKRIRALEARLLSRASQEKFVPLQEELRLTETQLIENNTFEAIEWDESLGPHTGVFWDVSDPTRIYAPLDGFYHIYAETEWPAFGSNTDVADFWGTTIFDNDTTNRRAFTNMGPVSRHPLIAPVPSVSAVLRIEADEWIRIAAFTSNSGNRFLQIANTRVRITYQGPFISLDSLDTVS